MTHDTFHPVRLVDGRMVVAGEEEWLLIEGANVISGPPVRVLISPEVFGEWDGPITDPVTGNSMIEYDNANHRYVRIEDIRARVYRLINSCSGLTFCIETDRPLEVAKMVPRYLCESCGGLGKFANTSKYGPRSHENGDCGGCGGEGKLGHHKFPPNLWLGTGTIRTQADADRLIPELLKVPAALRYVVVEPREEIDLMEIEDSLNGEKRWWSAMKTGSPEGQKLGWLIVDGTDKPVHPDWVRSLRDQAIGAGVPFAFESWGDWIPAEWDAGGPTGKFFDVKLSDFVKFKGMTFVRVGRKHSGRVLDGKIWEGVPG